MERKLSAQSVPLTVAADILSLTGREDIFLHGGGKIFKTYYRSLGQSAAGEDLTVVNFGFTRAFSGDGITAFSVSVMRTAGADIVRLTKQNHFWIFVQFFFHRLHIFRECTTVAFALKKGETHTMVRSDFVSHYGQSIIRDNGPRSIFPSSRANPILITSGMIKGITHQPSTVVSPMGPASFIYTSINHTVPAA